ncbi:hypothetical protein DXT99_02610 [Pontibacter diazotrophicus]|uniref:HTTM domain-containing protein n=1 Tax=Pontibacter diazotrophicus TaxID=1400979 RepID=A0A3D8LGY2_9BACT|nr:HTTM domain-containing protein [Pontibacter diazotrophicus]RDV16693.1 hypothetical protein DXT99_02610 [Pontibacter diazotrophicus]
MIINKVLPADGLSLGDPDVVTPKKLHFQIFCSLWAIATLFHMAQSSAFDARLHYVLLTIAVASVLYRPSSIPRFVMLIALQLGDVFYKMPALSNHWIFTALVDLTILHALLYLIIKHRSFRIRQEDLLNTFAPFVRVEVIILYFFVTFHKLNEDFFSPIGSCAAFFLQAQNSRGFFSLTPEFLALNAYFTIFVESLIPVMLCFRRTRIWGILIGLVFHCIIAYNPLNGFYDFSSMIFAVYFLFTSPQFGNSVAAKWAQVKEQLKGIRERAETYSFSKVVLAAVCFAGVVLTSVVLTKRVDDFHLFFFWTGFSFVYILLFFRYMAGRSERSHLPNRYSLSIPHWSFLIIPLLVFINGGSPYLGLKTESSFAMFSNLKTEGGVTNHFIVPAGVQVFDFQKDMVEVVSSSDKELQALAANRKLMAYFEFKDYVASNKPQFVEYIRKGKQYTFNLAEANHTHELMSQNPYLLRRLLSFREINKYDPQPCYH